MIETLNALIVKWRTQADRSEVYGGAAKRECADELSSALAGIARPSPQELLKEAIDLLRYDVYCPEPDCDHCMNVKDFLQKVNALDAAALAAPPEGWQDKERCPVYHFSGTRCQLADRHEGLHRHEQQIVTTWFTDSRELQRIREIEAASSSGETEPPR